MSDSLKGPGRSRDSIRQLEDWLRVVCKTQKKVEEIDAEWQYLTGHEPRKIRQYLKAIQSQGKIKLFNNEGEQCCVWDEGQHEKQASKLSKKAEEFFEKCRIKEKMLAGPCAHGCEIKTEKDPDCRNCSAFRNLKNEDFLEEEYLEEE